MQDTELIPLDRSVIVAADVSSGNSFSDLCKATREVRGISAFKFGISLGLQGLRSMINVAKLHWDKRQFVTIYDHQKAGNDIPDMGKTFARTLADCGVDAAIIFPFTGPATQVAWTDALDAAGLTVIVGGIMTHQKFLQSEDGYIANDAPERIYRLAAKMGVRHFVVPGNKLDWVKKIRSLLEDELGAGNFVLYAPGFITQGGDLSECGVAAGRKFHGIVGSGIYGKDRINTEAEMRAAALACTSRLGVPA